MFLRKYIKRFSNHIVIAFIFQFTIKLHLKIILHSIEQLVFQFIFKLHSDNPSYFNRMFKLSNERSKRSFVLFIFIKGVDDLKNVLTLLKKNAVQFMI